MLTILSATQMPGAIIEAMEFNLTAAIVCLAGGFVLLIAAVIALKIQGRKADKETFRR